MSRPAGSAGRAMRRPMAVVPVKPLAAALGRLAGVLAPDERRARQAARRSASIAACANANAVPRAKNGFVQTAASPTVTRPATAGNQRVFSSPPMNSTSLTGSATLGSIQPAMAGIDIASAWWASGPRSDARSSSSDAPTISASDRWSSSARVSTAR